MTEDLPCSFIIFPLSSDGQEYTLKISSYCPNIAEKDMERLYLKNWQG